MSDLFEVVEKYSGVLVSDEPLDWIDALALADVWEDKGYPCEINEVDLSEQTPSETNEWLRSGGF